MTEFEILKNIITESAEALIMVVNVILHLGKQTVFQPNY